MNTTIRLTFGDETFDMAHIKASEMAQVKSWTGIANRGVWLQAITREDPDALTAALTLAKLRRGEQVKFSQVDFDLDELKVSLVNDAGAEVEPVFVLGPDGEPLLVKYVNGRPSRDDRGGYVIDEEDGLPVPEVDEAGGQKWRYVDTGDPVPTSAA